MILGVHRYSVTSGRNRILLVMLPLLAGTDEKIIAGTGSLSSLGKILKSSHTYRSDIWTDFALLPTFQSHKSTTLDIYSNFFKLRFTVDKVTCNYKRFNLMNSVLVSAGSSGPIYFRIRPNLKYCFRWIPKLRFHTSDTSMMCDNSH